VAGTPPAKRMTQAAEQANQTAGNPGAAGLGKVHDNPHISARAAAAAQCLGARASKIVSFCVPQVMQRAVKALQGGLAREAVLPSVGCVVGAAAVASLARLAVGCGDTAAVAPRCEVRNW
jgi:hypothetical protein